MREHQHPNMFNARLVNQDNSILIALNETTKLHIPLEHQQRLAEYPDQDVVYGLRSEFIREAEQDEAFNTVDAELLACRPVSGGNYHEFGIGESRIICQFKSLLTEKNIGERVRLNFDTFFGHVYDREIEMNLTI
ncbi:hypothetical protein [Vibrio sp. WXL210]|uniref:hypothetical protein n=1 Tax=Vibrio sp. WXL210 TaxID=3450709 RepID=UPI003EC52977